jgi:uncharacterized protein
VDLAGAHVVITGGSQGIGEAMARAFAAKGSRVTVVARQAEKLAAVAKSIGGAAFVADLLNEAQTATLIAEIEAAHGPIDVLVNNAGIEVTHPFASMDQQKIAPLIALNVVAPMVLTRQVLPGMLSRGKGHVVFTSSLAGSSVFPGMAVYCGSKAAVNNFAGTIRSELAKTPVGVTLVAPGPVDTLMWDRVKDSPPSSQRVVKRLQRMQLIPKADPNDIAKRTVEAVATGRRHVRDPKRLSITFWLNEAPRRLVDLLLLGVKFDPQDRL